MTLILFASLWIDDATSLDIFAAAFGLITKVGAFLIVLSRDAWFAQFYELFGSRWNSNLLVGIAPHLRTMHLVRFALGRIGHLALSNVFVAARCWSTSINTSLSAIGRKQCTGTFLLKICRSFGNGTLFIRISPYYPAMCFVAQA